MSLRDHLTAIYEAHGDLTPSIVVAEARNPSHPLHDRFEWDDAAAGEKYREQQARELIRSVRVVESDGLPSESVRAFHSLPRDGGRSYVPIDEIKADPISTQIVLREAEREWRQLFRRYGHLAEWLDAVRKDAAA